jgi:CheY-like chemotaxis protein
VSALKILVAEDSRDDAEILKMAFKRADFLVPLHFVSDGQEAIEYLSGTGQYSDRIQYPLPSLLLLDLKMPRKDGFDVLSWLGFQTAFPGLIVIVYSTSDLPQDVARAYELGANSYVTKRFGLHDAELLARQLEAYWFKFNRWSRCIPRPMQPLPPLRVLVRNIRTGQYYQGPDAWTDDPDKALDFERTERAVQCALTMNTSPLKVVIDIDSALSRAHSPELTTTS